MKIKHLRAERGWTQEQLAKKARVHLTTIGKLEAGIHTQITLPTRKKLAKALGVPITELLD